ncbi:unnamed protein product [Acanthoscelides obtectus]|uniref:Uncharacterized protein n=1 Tax=Acanthoscelides obtectus TaxID=200917 RepID=A0A9P0MGQ8_ACAOB|nr:unnamed protein product [Acanthoscelides obtectus]CAK1659558.1 hypothetical protein AOBTE_LOCUS21535 [Acanthoscelides obtectus]
MWGPIEYTNSNFLFWKLHLQPYIFKTLPK